VAYNTFGIDLDDVSRVYYNVLNHYLVETKLDYERYTANPADPASGWKITAIHNMHQQGEVDLGQTVPFGYGHVIAFTAGNGQRYLFRPNKLNRTRSGSAGLYRWAGRWVPAAFLSHTNKPDSSWVDKNGDGMVQKDEMFGPLPTATFSWIDRDLNLYGFDGIISPTGIDSHGVPQYDGGKFTPHFKPGVETCLGDEHNFVSAPAEDGSIYYAVNVGPHRHRSFWDRASETRVVKVKDGEVQWVVGEQSPHPINSELSTLSGIAGSVDEIVLAHVVEPPNYVAFTSDGMTLGNVFGDQTRGARTGPTAIYIESFTGLFIKDPKTGKRLLLSVSSGDDRILEVTGPGKTDRYEGTITLDSARPQAPTTDRIEIPYETLYGNTSRKQGVDGYPYDWQPEARGIPVYNDKGVLVADIRLRRDAGALHVLATVLTKDAIRPDEGIELFLAPNNAQAAGRRVQLIATPEGTKEKYGVFIQSTDAANPTPQPIADAKIAVVPRWRGLGYRLEAEIPLSSFPDLVKDTEQTYRRQGKSKDNRTDIQSYTSTLPDLAGPVRFNAAVRMADGKGVQRIFWLKPGTNAAGPGENAVAWGLATPTPPAAE
jgi:hypothetical protein